MRGFADEVHGTVQYSYDIRTRGGVVNKVGYYNFDKIRDVIGPGEARARLLAEARQSGGRFLIELPGLPQEEYKGEGNITSQIPADRDCPEGTRAQ